MKEKFKNYGFWVSVAALVGLLLKDLGIYPENFEVYVNIIMSILICAGFISAPEKGKWYKDK